MYIALLHAVTTPYMCCYAMGGCSVSDHNGSVGICTAGVIMHCTGRLLGRPGSGVPGGGRSRSPEGGISGLATGTIPAESSSGEHSTGGDLRGGAARMRGVVGGRDGMGGGPRGGSEERTV